MTKDPYRRIFPLNLTAFERFMQTDDRAEYPMTFVIEMDFAGILKRPEFEDAVRQTLERHPLFISRVEIGKRGIPVWILDRNLEPTISFGSKEDPIECPTGETFDNDKEAGVRIYVRQGDEKVRVTFYFDHKATDGVAAHTFCGEVFAFYANAVEGKEVAQVLDLNPVLLKTRQKRQLFYGGITLKNERNWKAWISAIKLTGFSSQILASRHKRGDSQIIPRFGVLTRSLDAQEHKLLRDAAIQKGITVNDIVITELILTMIAWNKRLNKLNGRKIKILMPSNLRRRGDDEMPNANMTTYNFITRKPKQCLDRFEMIKGIRDDTNNIKNNATGAEFLEILAKGFTYSWLIPFLVSSRSTLCTSVISNVGDPTRRYTARIPRKKGDLICGNLTLEQVGGSPPLRPNTRSGWAITTYRRKFTVSVRCDPYLYDEKDTSELLDIFFAGLRAWISPEK
jgi:hypothetical protein